MSSAARDSDERRSASRDSTEGDDQARPVASPDKDNQSDGEPESDEEGETHEDEVEIANADTKRVEKQDATSAPSNTDGIAETPPLPSEDVPPLPAEDVPPLPSEAPPSATEQDDGWAPIWEEIAQAFYFYNRFTGATQWTNPRVPEALVSVPTIGPPGVPVIPRIPIPAEPTPLPAAMTGYNPAIHGDYDPNAWYAQPAAAEAPLDPSADPAAAYAATAAFNRFTGRFQASEITPELHNDENKSKRQRNAFFDVDAAANSHDGRSLKEERAMKKLSKQELKQFKEKRRAKKEEKRRAWLRD